MASVCVSWWNVSRVDGRVIDGARARRRTSRTPSPRRRGETRVASRRWRRCGCESTRRFHVARAIRHRGDGVPVRVAVEGPRTPKSHVSTFTSCKISAAEATSPWRSLSADSMRVSLARSASQYIFPSVTSQSVLSSSSLVASSSFTDVSSSCSKPCATIPVIATFDCDRRFARSCEFAIK